MMDMIAYLARCIVMLLVTWAAVRLIGKKSISNMTSYDLASIMLITTVAAEPLVYKVPSKASVGVIVLTLATLIIGYASLKRFFYNIDSTPIIVVAEGKIIKKTLKNAKMNIPLLLSELRIKGFQNIADVRYAIIEPSGKLSVIPTSQASPVQQSDIGIAPSSVSLSFPLVIDGKVIQENLAFLQQDRSWLMAQLLTYSITDLEQVLLAQMDGQRTIQVIRKDQSAAIPHIK
ncbi:DUF421 domain-containing protein [Halobacillus rhizosphaerae]|uniref:DUF421 domain-containing protein n=1 Tax=Halobacillus rhizosphaerae TaxID=3064889 RepID=UPI00398AC0CA